ncbi:26s proteasome regulatory subunit 4 [Vairimorpha apis BRL 01]|uniref:26s proteasome regulatory subunit 4 n=1 Tax=Vairimorpha apis BRL 01 TaxID=1037528 RepID=T0KYY2_9MICR|nr:26s proteasome regulatory subunit 4 [Vairimorpha apis BRL 01]
MLVDLVKSSHSGSISTLSFQVLSERKYDLLDLCSKLENEQSKKIFDIISAISIIGDDEDILRYRILEIKDIENIVNYVDIHNYKRIIKYLGEMSVFYDLNDILVKIYLKTKDYTRYIINLIEQNFIDEAIEFVKKIDDKMVKRQLLYVLARLNIFYDTKILDEKVILSNNHIKDIYTQLINIYELNSDKTKTSMLNKLKYEKDAKNIQQNSFNAITVCNGFINLGYSHDTIFFPAEESVNDGFDYQTVLNSNIPELITIIASVGCIEFWNPSKVLEILQEHIFGEISIKKQEHY